MRGRRAFAAVSLAAAAVMGGVVVAPAEAAAPSPSASAMADPAACKGHKVANLDGRVLGLRKGVKAANIRSGPWIKCKVRGIAKDEHDLKYHCWKKIPQADFTWTHLKNLDTGVQGWVRDDLLKDGGANKKCPKTVTAGFHELDAYQDEGGFQASGFQEEAGFGFGGDYWEAGD
jgi:hypothetical protein